MKLSKAMVMNRGLRELKRKGIVPDEALMIKLDSMAAALTGGTLAPEDAIARVMRMKHKDDPVTPEEEGVKP